MNKTVTIDGTSWNYSLFSADVTVPVQCHCCLHPWCLPFDRFQGAIHGCLLLLERISPFRRWLLARRETAYNAAGGTKTIFEVRSTYRRAKGWNKWTTTKRLRPVKRKPSKDVAAMGTGEKIPPKALHGSRWSAGSADGSKPDGRTTRWNASIPMNGEKICGSAFQAYWALKFETIMDGPAASNNTYISTV